MKTCMGTALIGLLVAGCLSGCGSEPEGKREAAAAPERRPGLRIAMIAKSATNPIFLSARNGAETAAKELALRYGIPIEIVWMTPTTRTRRSRHRTSRGRSRRGRAPS